jgi:endonuclease/exonuclease/phosphatase family metal-dependent hydrolase
MRLATFNVRHGVRRGRRVDVEGLVASCQALRADVLALQELDRGTARVGGVDLASAICEATAMSVVFGATLTLQGGEYGNALLVAAGWTVGDVAHLALPGTGEPRAAILATACDGEGHELSVAATHLSTRRRQSSAQLAAVLDELRRRPAPRALLGDLNRTPAELPADAGVVWAGGPPTFPNGRPVLRIDHVGVDELSIVAVEVVRPAVSDHRAVVVTAELR